MKKQLIISLTITMLTVIGIQNINADTYPMPDYYSVELIDVSDDGTYQTWTYMICFDPDMPKTNEMKDISHFLFWFSKIGICDPPLSYIYDYDPTENVEISSNFPLESAAFGVTVPGIKWDTAIPYGSCITVSFTLDEIYKTGTIDFIIKAGPDYYYITVEGPDCDGPPEFVVPENPFGALGALTSMIVVLLLSRSKKTSIS